MTFAHFRAPLALSLGAIPGALSRYYLGGWLSELTGLENFPIGTMGINLLGCFLMGSFIAWSYRYETIPPEIRLLVATGFLGSLTTFSSYELELETLADTRGWQQDLLYGLGSPLLGLAFLYGGLALGEVRGEGSNGGDQ
jgi:CrcB protein